MSAKEIHEQHSTVVKISQAGFALGVAATLYDQSCQEEQRILREIGRQMERLNKCRADKQKYGNMIGMN